MTLDVDRKSVPAPAESTPPGRNTGLDRDAIVVIAVAGVVLLGWFAVCGGFPYS